MAHIPAVKRCPRCGQVKSKKEFYLRRSTEYRQARLESSCKECQKAVQKVRRERYGKGDQSVISFRAGKGSERLFISRTAYNRMLEQQGGVCAICQQPETTMHRKSGVVHRLSIDHDHITGVVRGLLCRRCNLAVGLLRDDPEHMWRTIEYLQNTEPEERPQSQRSRSAVAIKPDLVRLLSQAYTQAMQRHLASDPEQKEHSA